VWNKYYLLTLSKIRTDILEDPRNVQNVCKVFNVDTSKLSLDGRFYKLFMKIATHYDCVIIKSLFDSS